MRHIRSKGQNSMGFIIDTVTHLVHFPSNSLAPFESRKCA